MFGLLRENLGSFFVINCTSNLCVYCKKPTRWSLCWLFVGCLSRTHTHTHRGCAVVLCGVCSAATWHEALLMQCWIRRQLVKRTSFMGKSVVDCLFNVYGYFRVNLVFFNCSLYSVTSQHLDPLCLANWQHISTDSTSTQQ